MKAAILVAAFLSILPAGAQTTGVVTTYNAITDRTVRPKPPLPSLGLAGSIVVDPTFKNRILRVTDGATSPDIPNISHYTTAGSFMNTWSADSRHFFIHNDDGFTLLFSFDPDAFKTAFVRKVPLSGPCFSWRSPNIIYGVAGANGRTIVAFDITTGAVTPVLDLNTVVPNYPGYQYGVSVSDDDNKFAISFGGIQNTYQYVVVYDRAANTRHLFDLSKNTIDGRPSGIPAVSGWGIHSQQLDRTGNYVEFDGPGFPGSSVWNVRAGTITPYKTQTSGHDVVGFGVRVNQSGSIIYSVGTDDSRGLTLRSLEDPANNLKQLISPEPPPPYSWLDDGHWSWANAKAGVMAPVVGSFFREPENSSLPWGLWDDEIVGVRTDGGESTVWRFAHHRSIFDGSNFWDCPRGNISQDGKYFIFTSNWEKTLGADPYGNARQDVFLLELPAVAGAAVDSAAPAVSIISPAANATVSGLVTVQASASDNVAVAGMQFKVDGANLGAELIAPPYTVVLDTTSIAKPSVVLSAVARDAAGNQTTSAPLTLNIAQPDTASPSVAITSPAAGSTVSGIVTIAASATDSAGVAGVQFLVNGAPLGQELTASPYGVAWNTASLANGIYSLTARARDAAGNVAVSAPVQVTLRQPDTAPPAVAITAPVNGATLVPGTITISASASDDSGVAGVQFCVNGSPVGAELTTAPYSVSWDARAIPAGSYVLTARARDAAGNLQTSAPVTVMIGVPAGTQSFSPIRINAGGPAYTDPQGRVWSADNGFSGGGTYATTAGISNTQTPALYQSERYGQVAYRFAVPNGAYTVNLKFAEIYFTKRGQRVFNVVLNGSAVLSNFDIVAAAGGAKVAIDRAFSALVANGEIVIQLAAVVENPKISAIEITPALPVRINAGGPAYTDPSGQPWGADANFTGGAVYGTTASISGTSTPELYRTERYGNLAYSFTLPNGTYQVMLKFAEIYFTGPGQRVFNVVINGQTVLQNFDIFAQAGGVNIALDRQFAVAVTNGKLTIQLVPVIENPKISAIQIN